MMRDDTKHPEPAISNFLPKRIRRCPECGDRDEVQVIVYGMPAMPPTPEEEDRVVFAGCMFPLDEEPPKWRCPTCDVAYTGRGVIVTDANGA